MSNTSIRVITEPEEFATLKEVWNRLLPQCADDSSIYLTHEWLSTWWKYFGYGKKLHLLLIEKGLQVIGVVPLMEVEYRAPLHRFHVLETVGSVNCNYIGLIPPENGDETVTALLTYLEDQLNKSRLVLRLVMVPEDSKILALMRKHGSMLAKNLRIDEKVNTLAPYVPLPATWDDYFLSLSQNRRAILRRVLRSLEKEHKVELKEYPPGCLEAGLNEFFELHQQRWQSINIRGVFSSAQMREFYLDIANQFQQKNWLHFSCLTADNEVVSAVYGFVYNNKLYCTTAARDIRYSKYSVGHIHQMFLIKQAISKGLREYDFLKGDEPYKFHWTKSARKYFQVAVFKKGPYLSLHFKLLQLWSRLQTIRQYSVRELYSRYLIRRRERKEKKSAGLEC